MTTPESLLAELTRQLSQLLQRQPSREAYRDSGNIVTQFDLPETTTLVVKVWEDASFPNRSMLTYGLVLSGWAGPLKLAIDVTRWWSVFAADPVAVPAHVAETLRAATAVWSQSAVAAPSSASVVPKERVRKRRLVFE